VKRGGAAVSISGPPDPSFASERGLNLVLKLVMRLVSARIRKPANRRRFRYSFLFMVGSGAQLTKISPLLEAGIIRPLVDRVAITPVADDKRRAPALPAARGC
jgi:hypothetical protein